MPLKSNTKTIDQERAESAGYEFARSRKLGREDPIVKDLIRGLKLSLGKMRYRNRLKAEEDARQPGLFPQPKRSNVAAIRPVEAAESLGGAPVPDECDAGQAYFNGEDL